ncbi:MAG TPA: hypothetical protein PKV16_06845 [Caldisericia bacterium]|nr:hypothetical protein [Caldisericia bacterium]HPF49484.1 hypothetical protein [Caldisericia bacterium]HPI84222.1 hypothetical protein [Caldisericia bacterium]HPQ93483.1 hypothetical protein [Caldisericia bacterium]HRV75511.1 hypothetical protein [Caldisericia bacterium]
MNEFLIASAEVAEHGANGDGGFNGMIVLFVVIGIALMIPLVLYLIDLFSRDKNPEVKAPKEKEPPKKAAVSEIKGNFIGSKNMVFHLPSCRFAKKIKKGTEVWFEKREDALAAGYDPCDHCALLPGEEPG